MECRRNLVKDS